jgi:hypothetical protein
MWLGAKSGAWQKMSVDDSKAHRWLVVGARGIVRRIGRIGKLTPPWQTHPFVTLIHELHGFGPPLNHLVRREGCWPSPLVARIELFAADQSSAVWNHPTAIKNTKKERMQHGAQGWVDINSSLEWPHHTVV